MLRNTATPATSINQAHMLARRAFGKRRESGPEVLSLEIGVLDTPQRMHRKGRPRGRPFVSSWSFSAAGYFHQHQLTIFPFECDPVDDLFVNIRAVGLDRQ